MMKKLAFVNKKNIVFVLFFFCVTTLFSQESKLKVKGYIHDSEGPIENAYVEFTRDSISIICISGADGRFVSSQLMKGVYQITIRHLSHTPIYRKSNIQEAMDFVMEISDHLLDEITIKGDIKKALRIENGNTILNPSYLGNIKMSSAYQLISKIPGVNITSSGVSINGLSSGFKIDGRNTGLSSSSIIAYLKSIPADKIKEVIVTSSAVAENNASNIGGVINISLKKENDDSQSLSLSGNLETVSGELAGSSSGFYSMQKGKTYLSLFLEHENDYTKKKKNTHTTFSDKGVSNGSENYKSRGNNYFGVLNLDHTFKNNNILHFNGSFYYEDYNRNNESIQDYYQVNNLLEKSKDRTKFNDIGDLFRVYLDYNTDNALKWKHEVGYGLVWGKSNGSTNNYNTSEKPKEIGMSEIAIQNKHHGVQHQIHYNLIYSHNNLEFKIGARADLGNLFPSTRYDSIISGKPIYNPLFSSEYKYKENIYAGYASLQYKYKKVSMYVGVRAEVTQMSVNSAFDKIDWNYNKAHIFPYAKINTTFDKLNTSLSFSSGIDRPPYLYYTPNYRYSSKYSYSIGNRNLLPSKYYKVGLENLLFDFLKIDFSYVYKKDSYKSITYNGENDFEEITTYLNYANENKFISNIYLPYLFYNDKISGYLGFYGEYSTLVAYNKKLNFYNKRIRGFIISNSTDYNITKNLTIGYNFKYQGPMYFEQTKQNSFCRFDLYSSYTFKRFTFGVQAYDILNKDRRKGTWYYVNNTTDFDINTYAQRFAVSIRYNFMKGKKIKERDDRGADTNRFK